VPSRSACYAARDAGLPRGGEVNTPTQALAEGTSSTRTRCTSAMISN